MRSAEPIVPDRNERAGGAQSGWLRLATWRPSLATVMPAEVESIGVGDAVLALHGDNWHPGYVRQISQEAEGPLRADVWGSEVTVTWIYADQLIRDPDQTGEVEALPPGSENGLHWQPVEPAETVGAGNQVRGAR